MSIVGRTEVVKYMIIGKSEAGVPHLPEDGIHSLDAGGFTIRILRNARDAVQVADCAYATYEADFPLDIAYHPAKLMEANRCGTIVSIIAESDSGRICGHGALARGTNTDMCGEMCMGFVHPDFRRCGLLGEIAEFIVLTAVELGLRQIYCGSVMQHIHSQKPAFRLGFTETAIKLGYVEPLAIKSMGIASDGQRTSVLVQTRQLQAVGHEAWYIPEKHRDMLRVITDWRSESPQFVVDDPYLPFVLDANTHVSSTMVSSYSHSQKYAKIEVRLSRADSLDHLRRKISDFLLLGAECIHIFVPLEQGVSKIVAFLESLRFFFGGIHPLGDGRDALLMQYLVADVDMAGFQFFHERCAILAKYIGAEKGRIF